MMYDSRCAKLRKPVRPVAPGARESSITDRRREHGVALVITLIMLAVITFMATTFLVLSQRERGAVTTTTEQNVARFAADSALERVKVELLAPMLAYTNSQIYDLAISTNYIQGGFVSGLNFYQPTNVSYQYWDGTPLNDNDALRNLANLFYDPRPPVYVTNKFGGSNEFRFYLDLNRNGRYEPSGWRPVLGANGSPIVVGGATNYGYFTGDPEWIGVLEYPDRPHSGDNRFIARYAYVAVPADKTLDVNRIHNQAGTRTLNGADGFVRNQGVGPWEINFAAFLTDLNTNAWPPNSYNYFRPNGLANSGMAFDHALSFLRYRYAGNYNNLRSANVLFGFNAAPFVNDRIDQYSDGPLQFGTPLNGDGDLTSAPWAGDENPNQFFTTQDFYDPDKAAVGINTPAFSFIDRLNMASASGSSYDRYTFYRMLAQLGTDSTPDRGKINVNYRNVDGFGNVIPGMETNLLPWTAGHFFTNAADRLLKLSTEKWLRDLNQRYGNTSDFIATFGVNQPFGITNIPVFITVPEFGTNIFGYTPSVHRALQVIANIYEATTNRSDLSAYPYVPHVYRPVFRRNPGPVVTNVFIVGYREVTDLSIVPTLGTSFGMAMPPVDLQDPNDRQRVLAFGVPIGANSTEPMVMGVPLIIGAKKGFPNFNKFALQNSISVTRKLQFQRPPGQPVNQTNQVYSFAISNAFGMQAWNSYGVAFPRTLQLRAVADVTLVVTNEIGAIAGPFGPPLSNRYFVSIVTNIPANTWREFTSPQQSISFVVPFITNAIFLTNSSYLQLAAAGGSFNRAIPVEWDPANRFRVPKLWLNTRTRVRFVLIDTSVSPNRIVDYVNLDSAEAPLDLLTTARGDVAPNENLSSTPNPGVMWLTNRIGDPTGTGNVTLDTVPTYGVFNQIRVSLGSPTVSDSFWRRYNSTVNDKTSSIREFQRRMFSNGTNAADLVFNAPFNPSRHFYQYVRWEANDPLVHYIISDLTDLLQTVETVQWDENTRSPIRRLVAENPLSDNYRPWGGNPNNPAETSPPTRLNPGVKDPLVTRSDDWDFPTNKLPNIGWLGRVHRGTPWQTVYLKAFDATNSWARWSGNRNPADAWWSRPANDRLLFDILTAAPSENASRGRLSINQTNLAAWSAVLSGVIVATNNAGGWTVIEPASVSPELEYIVAGINETRASTNQAGFNNFAGKLFQSAGDILATPHLTDRSPFLSTTNMTVASAAGLTDAVYERIPQQIMSLLTLNPSPRFVVYAYGQALRPAERSVITSGPYRGMSTNYQVVAEAATRAVIRVEGAFDQQYRGTNANALGQTYPPRIVVEQFNALPPE